MQEHRRWIFGSPRSGTTLLTGLLAGRDDLLAFSEPLLAQAVLPDWKLARFLEGICRSIGLATVARPFRGEPKRMLAYLDRLAHANKFQFLVIKETYREAGLPPVWRNERLLSELMSAGGRAVGLIRDPYDTAASTVRLCRPLLGLRGRLLRLRWAVLPAFDDETAIVHVAAANWVSYVNWSRGQDLMLVRYEDLVADPQTHLPRVCEQLVLPFTSRMLAHNDVPRAVGGLGDEGVLSGPPRKVDTRAVGRGQSLSDEQRGIVQRVCGAVAAEFGYEVCRSELSKAAT